MKYFYLSFILLSIQTPIWSQEEDKKIPILLCEDSKGCNLIKDGTNYSEVAYLYQRADVMYNINDSSKIILDECSIKLIDNKTINQIHKEYGGTGEIETLSTFNLNDYYSKNKCVPCSKDTRKIFFTANGEGLSGSSFFYINFKEEEVDFPHSASVQLFGAIEGIDRLDQKIKNSQMHNYIIAQGQKFHYPNSIGLNHTKSSKDIINEKIFLEQMERTGNTRSSSLSPFLEEEYVGIDDEGNRIHIWICATSDVCLQAGKFDMVGMFNLGFIQLKGFNYIITEVSGANFYAKITKIENENYSFNPVGYQTISNPLR